LVVGCSGSEVHEEEAHGRMRPFTGSEPERLPMPPSSKAAILR
jgi:hypothetical protein